MSPIFTHAAIYAVISSTNLLALEKMLSQGLDPNVCIYSISQSKSSRIEPMPLVFYTVYKNWKEATQLLIEKKVQASIKFQGQPLISELIDKNDPESFEKLLDKGALPQEHLDHAFRMCVYRHFSAPSQALFFMTSLIRHGFYLHSETVKSLIEELKLDSLLQTLESLQQQEKMQLILPIAQLQIEKQKRL